MKLGDINKTYFNNLDAVRTFACLFVFISHFYGYVNTYEMGFVENWYYNHALHELGAIGVNLFFVLSGFLISYFLLLEKKSTSQINFKNFYIKRILRIWPVFFLVTLISFFALPLLNKSFDIHLVKQHLPYYLLFINNFDRINTGFTGIGNDALGVLWSVAVEEQFYLVWPILISLIREKVLPYVFFIIICISVVFRLYNVHLQETLYYHTLSLIGDLVIGSWSAYLVVYSKQLKVIVNMPRIYIVLAYIVLTAYLVIGNVMFQGTVLISVQRLIISILFAFVILEQSFSEKSLFKYHRLNNISSMALYTYGFYCYHTFFIMIIQKINVIFFSNSINSFVFYTEMIIVFFGCYTFSALSFKYFETYFLNKRSKLIAS